MSNPFTAVDRGDGPERSSSGPETLQDLIEASSFGSPGARELRDRAPDCAVEAILARVQGLEGRSLHIVGDDARRGEGEAGGVEESAEPPAASPVSDLAPPNATQSSLTSQEGYRSSVAQAAAGVSYRQMDLLARKGLVAPSLYRKSEDGRGRQLYSSRDILLLRVVKRLLDAAVPLPVIRDALRQLRRHPTDDLHRLTLASDGKKVQELTSADELARVLEDGYGVLAVGVGAAARDVRAALDALEALDTARAKSDSWPWLQPQMPLSSTHGRRRENKPASTSKWSAAPEVVGTREPLVWLRYTARSIALAGSASLLLTTNATNAALEQMQRGHWEIRRAALDEEERAVLQRTATLVLCAAGTAGGWGWSGLVSLWPWWGLWRVVEDLAPAVGRRRRRRRERTAGLTIALERLGASHATVGDAPPERLDDGVLLYRVSRSGDPEAFAALYSRHVQAARGLAAHLAHDPADADDFVAEAFVHVLQALRRGSGPSEAFRPYLLSTLRHIAHVRVSSRRPLERSDDVERNGVAVAVLPADSIVASLDRFYAATAWRGPSERWQGMLWHTQVDGEAPALVAPLLGLIPDGVTVVAYKAPKSLRTAFPPEHVDGNELTVNCR